jgi:hypothetical protein
MNKRLLLQLFLVVLAVCLVLPETDAFKLKFKKKKVFKVVKLPGHGSGGDAPAASRPHRPVPVAPVAPVVPVAPAVPSYEAPARPSRRPSAGGKKVVVPVKKKKKLPKLFGAGLKKFGPFKKMGGFLFG